MFTTMPARRREIPRWMQWAATTAALTPVPASLWRLPLIVGFPMGMDAEAMQSMMAHPFWFRVCYLVGLGVLSDGLAYLTLGLVRPWGEVWPRWTGRLRGRPLPPLVAIVPALIGGVAATALMTRMAVKWPTPFDAGMSGWDVLQVAVYAPLLLWGPLVLIVTGHYAWRRWAVPSPSRG